jgi:hypothetical protein
LASKHSDDQTDLVVTDGAGIMDEKARHRIGVAHIAIGAARRQQEVASPTVLTGIVPLSFGRCTISQTARAD